MSQKKQVIHVKDLVIKADNVHVERTRRRRKRDPFFGFPIEEKEESHDYKEREVYQEKEDDKEGSENKDDKDRYRF
ncbi:hypothetical protein [Lentibacillus sediminis]|uniref:hypothetical protein n=1 Tax=Lentibacillus sediminis TaxID=1940529 RepID=UPI000C1C5F0C|nr:hypothetical protein [Lentibacillus sediminis]